MSAENEPVVIVNQGDVEAALRLVLSELDYDLHKSIESDEETGEDNYPLLAGAMFQALRKSMAEHRLTGITLSVSGLRSYIGPDGQVHAEMEVAV